MSVLYRPARAHDLERADALVVSSMNDLTERHGFGPMGRPRPPVFLAFSLADDPHGLWVAEDGGEIVGFAFSWVCGSLWFLAQLFVAPGQQGRGVGNELLKRTFAHAEASGATDRALITFAFNRVSQGLYIKHGMLPRLPLYFLSVARDRLESRLQGAPLRSVPLADTPSHLRSLAEIDARALGVSREKHHRFLVGDGATQSLLLYAGSDCAGYVHIAADGHIGPLAVARPDLMEPAFRTALALAAGRNAAQVSAFLPGTSDALRVAVEYGMHITFPMVLMSARDFGDWTRYLPRNPGFM